MALAIDRSKSCRAQGALLPARKIQTHIGETAMDTLIQIRDLSKVYERGKQKVEVLHHINLDIAEGDFLALMGPSGSGKTTLLNLIGGGALAKWRASNVGFVFQFYNLMPMLSAQRNVELPLLLTKLSGAQRKK